MLRYDPDRLKRLRRRHGGGVLQLARRARVSVRTWYAIESGRAIPRADTLGRVAASDDRVLADPQFSWIWPWPAGRDLGLAPAGPTYCSHFHIPPRADR